MMEAIHTSPLSFVPGVVPGYQSQNVMVGKELDMRDDEYYGWPPVVPETEDPEEVLRRLVHEFGHPINAIKGYTTLILERGFDAQEAAEAIFKIVTNMEVVQNAIFDYLRARGGLE